MVRCQRQILESGWLGVGAAAHLPSLLLVARFDRCSGRAFEEVWPFRQKLAHVDCFVGELFENPPNCQPHRDLKSSINLLF